MSFFCGSYFPPRSARKIKVTAELKRGGELWISGAQLHLVHLLRQCRVSSRLASTDRIIYLPDDARLELADDDSLDHALCRSDLPGKLPWLYRLETCWHWMLVFILGCVVLVWTGFQFGIPALSKKITEAIPFSLEEDLGQWSLQNLQSFPMFAPSELSDETVQRLRERFQELADALPDSDAVTLRLEFQSSGIGPNAMALPGGIIILTDQIVEFADNDEQIMAVLAHEIGHARARHVLQYIVRQSFLWVLVSVLLGDLGGVAAILIASLPLTMGDLSYSRQFENEADRYAAELLRQHGIEVHHAEDLLRKLSEGESESGAWEYFSTHPSLQTRLENLRSPEPGAE